MRRRTWLLPLILFAACSKPEPMPDLFTETVAGGWHRTSIRTVSAWDAPDPVTRTAIEHLVIANYQGPGKLEARLYQLSSSGVAVDLVQRWHPSSDTVFFYARNYFVVVKWQEADRNALHQFVSAIENRLNPRPARPAQ